VIADDWTPFSIDESDYLIRVAEKDVDQLEEILRRAMNDYAQIQARAQAVYLHYFSPSQRLPHGSQKTGSTCRNSVSKHRFGFPQTPAQ
jgi:hypothetical protein